MAAIGYVRVSTDAQGDSGAGLAAQRDAIAAYAKKAGLDLVAVHEDAGVSGAAELADRPGLIAAIGQMKKGDVLIVAKRCRLGREQMAVLMIERAVTKRGASIRRPMESATATIHRPSSWPPSWTPPPPTNAT